MALIDFMRPKWKNGNEEVRLGAVQDLTETEIDTLSTIIQEDDSQKVKFAALGKINKIEQLEDLLRFDLDPLTSQTIRRKINLLLGKMLLDTIDDIDVEVILLRIDDPEILLDIATTAEDTELRLKAVYRIEDHELLCQVMEQNCGKQPALAALNKIDDLALLDRLCQNASNRSIRLLAAEKIASITSAMNPPDKQEIQQQELEQFTKEADDLTNTIDFDLAAGRLAELDKSWAQIDPEGRHPLRAAFDAAKNRFEDHKQNFLLQQEEESRQAEDYAGKIAACETVCTTIEALVGSPAENAESRFLATEKQWNCDPAEKRDPIVIELADRFEKACKSFLSTAKAVDKERELFADLNTGCGEVETLLASGNLPSADNRLLALENRFTSEPSKHQDSGKMKKRLESLRHRIGEQKKEQDEKNRLAMHENLEKRQSICAQIEELIQAENRVEAEKQAKTLRVAWDGLARLPEGRDAEEQTRYQTALDLFTERQQQFYHDQDWQRWANKTNKEELCALAEAFGQEENLSVLAIGIKDIQAKWKKIGPVPKEDADLLWERFHTACDQNFLRLEPYFEEQKQLRTKILQRKNEICQEAEELADSEQWRETAEILKAKQAEWKELGYTTRKNEDALYKKFRAACDIFFNRRQDHFKELDTERTANLEEKIKLCETAEALSAEPDWRNSKKLRDLQARWKKIGPAPRVQDQKAWQCFRTACDSFFNWLDGERLGNLEKKEQLCAKMDDLTASVTEETNLNEMAAKLHELQKQWKELGPVPNEIRDKIWERFHTPCEAFFTNRRQRFKELDKQRRENQDEKKNILQQAEATLQEKTGKEAAEKIRELQKLWNEIGPVPRAHEKELSRSFKELCNTFFQNRREKHDQFMVERLENLKKKEGICVQLENIIGTNAPEPDKSEKNQTLSLAEKFRLAREENFMLAGKRGDRRRQKEEILRLQKEWKKVGPVPRDKDKPLWTRFNKNLDVFFKENRESHEKDNKKL